MPAICSQNFLYGVFDDAMGRRLKGAVVESGLNCGQGGGSFETVQPARMNAFERVAR